MDDDAFIRRPLEFILREEGYQPVTAADADEGLRAIEACPPDLIFLDVMMPGKDGLTWCGELKTRRALRTASRSFCFPRAGTNTTANTHSRSVPRTFMTKPYSPHELKRRIP